MAHPGRHGHCLRRPRRRPGADLFVTNFYGESTTFFRGLGSGIFADQTAAVVFRGPSEFLLGFGISLLDANNDGRLDLAIANGHVNDDRPDYPYQMPALLMMGDEHGRLTDATQNSGEPWTLPRVARGLAVGDLDNDGRTDLVLIAQQSPLAYFHNRSDRRHAVSLRLRALGPTATVSVRSSLSKRAAAARRAMAFGRRQFSFRLRPATPFRPGERSDRIGRGSLAVGSSRSVWPSRVRQDLSDP